jgi:hypothetical protein
MIIPNRQCSKCGKKALFVASDDTCLEWFECGDHDELDNLVGVKRVALTPIGLWFKIRSYFTGK